MDPVRLVERVAAFDAACRDRDEIVATAQDVARLRRWLDGRDAAVAAAVARVSSFPEKVLADATRGTVRDAERAIERAELLQAAPAFASGVAAGDVGGGHVDALNRSLRGLGPDERTAVLAQGDRLASVAATVPVDEFTRTVKATVERVVRDDGMARLERQRRASRFRSWVDRTDGMWRFAGALDPVSGRALWERLTATKEALFHDQLPPTCPPDPIERDQHLGALALVALTEGRGAAGRTGFLAVIDADAPPVQGGPSVDWGIPVELPAEVIAALVGDQPVPAVVVRGGVVLHATGTLDMGRATRVANRPQRRALRAWYGTCAVPGCQVHVDRCRIHHVIWWRYGGRTDLGNLLPVCEQHHHRIHDDGWVVSLGPDRALTIRLPDGTVLTAPASRRRAA